MKTPLEIEAIVDKLQTGSFGSTPSKIEAYTNNFILISSEIEKALTQGRKEGREQGIRESAEVKVPFPPNVHTPWIEDIFVQGLEAKSLAILSLLTQPSPKEQEK